MINLRIYKTALLFRTQFIGLRRLNEWLQYETEEDDRPSLGRAMSGGGGSKGLSKQSAHYESSTLGDVRIVGDVSLSGRIEIQSLKPNQLADSNFSHTTKPVKRGPLEGQLIKIKDPRATRSGSGAGLQYRSVGSGWRAYKFETPPLTTHGDNVRLHFKGNFQIAPSASNPNVVCRITCGGLPRAVAVCDTQ